LAGLGRGGADATPASPTRTLQVLQEQVRALLTHVGRYWEAAFARVEPFLLKRGLLLYAAS
jgi:hypothetical protein